MSNQTQYVPGSIESYALERNHILELVEQITLKRAVHAKIPAISPVPEVHGG